MTEAEAPPPHVLEALGDLVGWLRRAEVPHTIIGGIALALVGHPRLTRDVDAVILMGDLSWEGFLDAAREAGLKF